MRILAIRGQGLASLQQPFALELDTQPLSEVGVLAITGPTGAGKSTVLDALCLALFDDIPRLVRHRGGAEDADGLPPHDVRQILSRGASQGWAEVDFLGIDRRRYRARWSVRRARGQATGRVQAQELTLTDLQTQAALGGARKTDTLRLIAERLGLVSGQFRRAVLLAQGEFAAFLQAPPSERAVLLERVTGTEIYALLSKACHQRLATLERAFEEARQGVERLAVLEPVARALLDEEASVARALLEGDELRVRDLEAALAWWQRHGVLVAEENAAALDLARAEAATLAAEPDRQALATARRAESLRPLAEALSSAAGKLTRLTRDAQECSARSVWLGEGLERHTREHGRLATALEEARRAEAEARDSPALRRPDLATAARAWELLESALGRAAKALAEESQAEAARPSLCDASERAAAEPGRLAVEVARLEGERATLRAELEAAPADPGWAARAAACDRLEQLCDLAAALARLEAETEEVASSLAAWRERLDTLARAGADAEVALRELGLRLDEAKLAREELRERQSLAVHRKRLRPGKPCPLCGSTEHRLGQLGLDLPRGDRVTELEGQLRKLGDEQAARTAEARSAHAEAAKLTRRQGEIVHENEALHVRWAGAGGGELRAADCLADDLARARAARDEALERVQAREKLQARLQEVGLRVEQAARDAERAQREADHAARAVAASFEALHRHRLARQAAVAEALPWLGGRQDWGERARLDPKGLRAELAREIVAHQGEVAAHGKRLSDEVLGAEAALREAESARARVSEERAAVEGEARRLVADLAAARSEHAEGHGALVAGLERAELSAEALARLLARGQAWIEEAQGQLAGLSARQERARTVLEERRRTAALHNVARRAGWADAPNEAALQAALADAIAALQARASAAQDLGFRRRQDDQARAARAALAPELLELERELGTWSALDQLIGSADGDRFRTFAQSLALDALVAEANRHLGDLSRRYRLGRVANTDLELQVIDREMGDERRGVMSLSGGESFLVSLALALALSSFSAKATQVGTLFIDEGFGTLDPQTLEQALAALDALQSGGRQIVLISHVPALGQVVGAEVAVVPTGGGRSRVRVRAARNRTIVQ